MAEAEGTLFEIITDLGDMTAVQARWAEEGMKRLLSRDLARFGFDDAMWEATKAGMKDQGEDAVNAEDVAGAVHSTLLATYSSSDTLAEIYMHIAGFLRDRDKDSRPAMREFYRQTLLSWKAFGVIRRVKVMAAPGCCRNCKAQDGLEMSLEDALRSPPLPCATCTAKLYGDEDAYPWCRCSLSPVVED